MMMLDIIKSWVQSRGKNNILLHSLLSKYRRLKRYSEFYIKDTSLPEYIQLEPTTKCNCNCITCGRKTSRSHLLKKDLSLDEFKRIISEIPSLKTVQLQGIGEPLMCDNFEEIIVYGLSKGIIFNTNSNATLLDDHNIDFVLKHFKVFNISFDSMIKENFEKIRIGADFDKIVHNIKRLIARKKELGAETRIVLYFVVTHRNYNELPLFFDFCENIGAEAEIRECMHWLWMNPEHKEYSEVTDFINSCRSVRDDI
ncbi:MAG: radical SAM protein, partial [Smithella sp.]